MNLAEHIRRQALEQLSQENLSHEQLNLVLRMFAKYRSVLIQNTLLQMYGTVVLAGPFAGMKFTPTSAEGCHAAKLLGCYEQELHDVVEAIVATGYEDVVNVGSAEGYYAVGLALRCPASRVYAYDANPRAQQTCRELAAGNNVSHRVTVAGEFTPESWREFSGRRALFVIDIEGNEQDLLEAAPTAGLAEFDLLIECHDCFRPNVSQRLAERLVETHAVRFVRQQIRAVNLPPIFDQLGHLDRLLAVWEWRLGPTPWLLAASHQRPHSAFFEAVSLLPNEG